MFISHVPKTSQKKHTFLNMFLGGPIGRPCCYPPLVVFFLQIKSSLWQEHAILLSVPLKCRLSYVQSTIDVASGCRHVGSGSSSCGHADNGASDDEEAEAYLNMFSCHGLNFQNYAPAYQKRGFEISLRRISSLGALEGAWIWINLHLRVCLPSLSPLPQLASGSLGFLPFGIRLARQGFRTTWDITGQKFQGVGLKWALSY